MGISYLAFKNLMMCRYLKGLDFLGLVGGGGNYVSMIVGDNLLQFYNLKVMTFSKAII